MNKTGENTLISMIITLKIILLLFGSFLYLFTAGCVKQDKTDGVVQDKSGAIGSLTDKPLAVYQKELLALAFQMASEIPTDPNIKDRSRAQEKVVAAALVLDQPKQAAGFIEKIDNWRRGTCYGDLALYCVSRGYTGEARQYVERAIPVPGVAQDWHKEQIMAKIAAVYTLLGEHALAEQYEKTIANSERGKVAKVKATSIGNDSFSEQVHNLDALIATGKFDVVEDALKVYANLFNRYYTDAERRSLVEEKMKTSWSTLPIFKRVELLSLLAGFALDHSDQAKALALVNEARGFIDNARWPPEYRISLISKLIKLQFRAGDTQKAKTDADALLAFFDLQRDKIVNIYRAEPLRLLAEAYQSMGNMAAALVIYKRAVEEGIENPNSRPRAEDLSATSLSMALHRVEPDAELWTRMRQINKGLRDPW